MSEYENECMLEGMCDVHVCISKCMSVYVYECVCVYVFVHVVCMFACV